MKSFLADDFLRGEGVEEVKKALESDGVIAFPCGSFYRLAVNFLSEKAVIQLLQIKRRIRNAPSLVFIPDSSLLPSLVEGVNDSVKKITSHFWPGPLTLLCKPNPDLPKKIVKNLQNKGKISVRIPSDPVAQKILAAFGGPLLISSANITKKSGEYSERQVKKNFARWIQVFISAGDIKPSGRSTVVDVTVDPPKIHREGVIPADEILKLLEQ